MPVEEFDSASSEDSDSLEEKNSQNLWLCGASKASMLMDGLEWQKKVINEYFVPIPYPKEMFEPVE